MREDLEQIKQRIPLLQYLQRRHWTGCRVAAREEFVGLCPLHRRYPAFVLCQCPKKSGNSSPLCINEVTGSLEKS